MYIFIFIVSVFISAVSQVLLKISAKKTYNSLLKEYLNPLVIFSYSLFFLSSFVTVFSYKKVPLSLGPILESSGYIFVSILSFFILKEKISKKMIFGMGLILFGIIMFNISF